MNRRETGPLGLDVIDIGARVRGLVTDPSIAMSLTLTTPTAEALDAASGVLTRTSVDNPVEGYMAPLTLREVEQSGVYQVGDQRVYVMAADLTIEPTTASWVTQDSDTYAVLTVERDPLGIFREVVVRRMEQA